MRWCLVLTLLLFGILMLVVPGTPCSCVNRHPQQHACESDFVLKVRVKKKTLTSSGDIAYKIRIKKLFKTNDKVDISLKKSLLYSSPSSASCGVKLDTRKTYLVTGYLVGRKPWVSLCNFAEEWKKLETKMKKGFKLLYQSSCNCKIMWERSWPKEQFFCSWETVGTSEDCQRKHGVCTHLPGGRCNWLGGRKYRDCFKEFRNNHQISHKPKQEIQDNRVLLINQNKPSISKPRKFSQRYRNNRFPSIDKQSVHRNRIGYFNYYKKKV